MAWSNTSSGKQGNKGHLPTPTNFTPSTQLIEQEQWRVAVDCANLIMQSKVVGNTGNFSVVLSGTANPGHPAGDTITVTVTST